ncbi:MAG TPA: hypothetical protein VEH56_01570 [Candidatus Saccharimonadales bacterium]|nr:hypothetical protein [Candidatus Saccharimonadales bacterium]
MEFSKILYDIRHRQDAEWRSKATPATQRRPPIGYTTITVRTQSLATDLGTASAL